MRQNKVVAVIGEIGSGKSSVIKIIEQLGYRVIISDDINKILLNNLNYRRLLKELFPYCFSEESLDKNKLRNIIANSKEEREKLNELAHPIIMGTINRKIEEMDDVVFVEISAPSEKNLKDFDDCILVKSNKYVRLLRIMMRDSMSKEGALSMIDMQKKIFEKIDTNHCFVINNDEDMENLRRQVSSVVSKIVK